MNSSNKKGTKRRKLLRLSIQLSAWIGVSVLYYIIFSIFFDTPLEYEIRKTNRDLKKEYELMNEQYDTLSQVLTSVIERDENIYGLLFESVPYSSIATKSDNWQSTDYLLSLTNNEIAELFFSKLSKLGSTVTEQESRFESLQKRMLDNILELNYIPAIQPVANRELTKLATSYGMRIHPFYKNMASHQGVDFAIPEDTRVYATADGRVSDVTSSLQGGGLSVIINHGNGYKTLYAHLNKSNVKVGQVVKRGDIIAHSGNSGLSFMPHLHYEVIHKGLRVDPINYFFYDLTPQEYIKIEEIAQIGMQSLD